LKKADGVNNISIGRFQYVFTFCPCSIANYAA
jgi:hypothetical protein